MRYAILVSMTAFGVAVVAVAADPCPPQYSSSLMSNQNLQTLNTAGTAASALPDAPQPQKSDKPWYRITLNGQVESGIPNPPSIELITASDSIQADPTTAPGRELVFQQLNQASVLYNQLTGTASGDPQTIAQMNTFLQQNTNIPFETKIELLSMLGNRLDELYTNNNGSKVTPLEQVFMSLKTGTDTAGVCRDIHTLLSLMGSDLGLKDAAPSSTDWNGDQHVLMHFQDPTTGKFAFLNYNDVFETSSNHLAESTVQAAEHLSPFSLAAQTQSGPTGGKLHQQELPRGAAALNTIDQASNMDGPKVTVVIGTEDDLASIQTKLFGGPNNRVGVFGVGEQNRQQGTANLAAGGVRLDTGKTVQLTKNTDIAYRGSVEGGVMDYSDQNNPNAQPGTVRNDPLIFAAIKQEVDYAWNEAKNKGEVGVRVTGAEDQYLNQDKEHGTPYNVVSVFAVDNLTKNIQIHAASNSFLATQTVQNTAMGLHRLDDNAGVTVTKTVDHGKIGLSSDTTVHALGGAGYGAYGVHEQAGVTINMGKKGTLQVGGGVGAIDNGSGDPYYDYRTTCEANVAYQKSIGKVTIVANGTAACNNSNEFPDFQSDPLSAPVGPVSQQPKLGGGLSISW